MEAAQNESLIDPATKSCLGAPSISASFCGNGWETMSLFSCRINSQINFLNGKRGEKRQIYRKPLNKSMS
jgi:hypothetical protein